jgi:hypothetical protein
MLATQGSNPVRPVLSSPEAGAIRQELWEDMSLHTTFTALVYG